MAGAMQRTRTASVKISFPLSRLLDYSGAIVASDVSQAGRTHLANFIPHSSADVDEASAERGFQQRRSAGEDTSLTSADAHDGRIVPTSRSVLLARVHLSNIVHLQALRGPMPASGFFQRNFYPVIENRLEVSSAHPRSLVLQSCSKQY
jgi:hypothetical protein